MLKYIKITMEDKQKQFVAYYRVSSKRQKEEGVSIDAQKKLIRDYCARNKFEIAKEFDIDESAKKEGRKSFDEMIAYIKAHPDVSGIIGEKVDRLLRGNLKDRITIEDLINEDGKEIHFVKEGMVLSRDSKSAQKLQFDIQNALARHFLNNLSDEVRKSYDILVSDGHYPHVPPLGYLSKLVDHVAQIDVERAPYIQRAFELCASGEYSEKQIGAILYKEGLRGRKGRRVNKSTIGKMLHDPFYYGSFNWKGQIHKGDYQPIFGKDLFDKVQDVLNPNKKRGYKHNFAFTGLIKCGECGSGITAETHKGHIYYRCTKPNGSKSCSQKYVREEAILEQFAEVVKAVSLDMKKLNVVKDIMKESHTDEEEYLRTSLEALNEHYSALKGKLARLLDMRLDEALNKEVYDAKSHELEVELEEVNRDIVSHKHADRAYFQEIESFLDFCNEAPVLFASSSPTLQRELLRFVVSNLFLKDKKLEFELRVPFSIVAKYSETHNWQGWKESDLHHRFWRPGFYH